MIVGGNINQKHDTVAYSLKHFRESSPLCCPQKLRALLTARMLRWKGKGRLVLRRYHCGYPQRPKKQLRALGFAQGLTPSFVRVCLWGGKSDVGHFPPGENYNNTRKHGAWWECSMGAGSLVLHMLKGLSRAEVRCQGHEAELMGQNFGSSADTLAQQETTSGGKGTTVECVTGSTRILFGDTTHSLASFRMRLKHQMTCTTVTWLSC